MKQRILAGLLALCLLVSLIPPVAAADLFSGTLEAAVAVELIESEEDRIELLNDGTTNYKEWAQTDSRWGSLPLGTSSCTVASHGCLVTSISKLLIQAGLKSADSFNVATLVNWLNSNTGFVSGTGNLYWAKITTYVPSFVNQGHILENDTFSSSAYNDQLISWIKQGYHMVLGVNSNGHWVAIDEAKSLATGTVYIMDTSSSSANVNITLASRYSTFNTVHAYKGGTTPSGSCTVIFDANGGTCSTGSSTVTAGSTIGTLPTATRDGYEFLGWYAQANASAIAPVTSSTVISDSITLYAHWGNIVTAATASPSMQAAATFRKPWPVTLSP